MICTFGDMTDVIWWRELRLPVRAVIQPNGTLGPVTWGAQGWASDDVAGAQAAYDQLAGLSAKKAQAKIVELLTASGALEGQPRPITHAVKFYEKGDRPLETTGMTMRIPPRPPQPVLFIRLAAPSVPQSWKPYLGEGALGALAASAA